MPDGEPVRRDRWFGEVAQLIAGMPKAESRERWIRVFAAAIHEKQDGLPIAVCTYIVQLRVEAAQKGGVMHRPNYRIPVAAGGTAEELLGPDAVELNEFLPDESRYDRMVIVGAVLLGLLILGLVFWPVILDWMTPFKYGVLAGALGMAALLIGGLAVGVCLGAGRVEKSR